MPDQLTTLRAQAQQLYEEEKSAEIIDLLTNEVLEQYQDAELYAWRARAHYRCEQNDEALLYAQKAIDRDSEYWMGYLARGVSLTKKFDYGKAISDFNKAIELKPDYFGNYGNRGTLWYRKSNYDEAFNDFNKTIELKPDDGMAYNNRGNVWLAKHDNDKAVNDYNRAIELEPNNGMFYFNRALAYDQQGNLKGAIEEHLKAIKLNYRISDSNHNIARLQNRLTVTLKEEITKDIDKIKSIVNAIRKRVVAGDEVKQVVHYSKLRVADILTNNCICHMHYSNVIYMNDPQEGKTFFEYLNDTEITEWYEKSSYKNESTIFLGSFLPVTNDADDSAEDQLLMWRTYGKDENGSDAGGCNFVIDTAFFKEEDPRAKFVLPKTFSGIKAMIEKGMPIPDDDRKSLLQVQYIRRNTIVTDDKKETLKQLIDYLKDKIKKLIAKNEKEKDNLDAKLFIESRIFDALQELCHLFKSADYSFEKEVRIISAEPRNSENILFYKNADGSELNPPRHFYLQSGKRILPYLNKIYLGPKVEKPSNWSLHLDYSLRKARKQEIKEATELVELRRIKGGLEPENTKRLQELENFYNGITDPAKEEIKPDQIEIIPSKCRFV